MKRFLFLLATSVLVGCSDGGGAPLPEACSDEDVIGETCAGVPAGATGDVGACSAVHEVAGAGELEAALRGSAPGDCVVLGPGAYAAIAVPEGVHVFGEHADAVTVGAVTVGTSWVADLTVESGTITVRSGARAKLSGIRVQESGDDGLVLEAGASATVLRTEILGAGRYGVRAFDAESIELEGSVIAGSGGPGLWVSCTGGCDCSGTVAASIEDTVIRDNRVVGLSLSGARAALDNVVVSGTRAGPSFDAGGGISASGCSDVDATRLTISGNADFGMLVDDSALALDGATIEDNLRGLWVQAIGATRPSSRVSVKNAVLIDNRGVGFGVDKAAINVSIESSRITGTRMERLPVLVNGVSANVLDVGDGLSWLGASQVSIRGVSLGDNARVGILIDGPVASGSAIEDLASSGTSGTLTILQQNLPEGGVQPSTSGTTPAIESDTSERLAIPSEITIPPSI